MTGMTEVMPPLAAKAAETGLELHLESAVREVFSTMVGSELEPAGDQPPLGLPNLTALVSLAGSFNGVVNVRCEMKTARLVAARMLGLTEEEPSTQSSAEIASDAADAMGEICNMVAGAFKTRVCTGGESCLLSVPSVIIGADYHLRLLAVSDKTDARFQLAGQPIWVSVERRQ